MFHSTLPPIRRSVRVRGFTLIEALITVAIVVILGSVALPTYREYVRRGTLPEAQTFLSDYRIKLEQFYQDNRNYGTGGCGLAAGGNASWSGFNPGAKNFGFVCALTNGGQGFTVTATGSNVATGHVYTVNEAGTRATTTFKGAAVAKNCWLVKGDEC